MIIPKCVDYSHTHWRFRGYDVQWCEECDKYWSVINFSEDICYKLEGEVLISFLLQHGETMYKPFVSRGFTILPLRPYK